MKPIPMLSIDLISDLDKQYPNRSPDITDAERLIWFKAGQRSVVDNLQSRSSTDNDGLPNVLQRN